MAGMSDTRSQPYDDGIAALLDRVNIGVFRVDNQTGLICRANEALARIVGAPSAADLIGANVLSHYADPAERQEALARFMSNPEVRERGFTRLEAKRLRADTGEPIDVLLTVVFRFGADGEVEAIDALMEDIGERKRAEKAYREGEARFRLIFESTAIGMAICDASWTVTRANESFRQFLGLGDDAILKSDVRAFLVEEDRDRLLARQSPEHRGLELRFSGRGGELRWGLTDVVWLQGTTGAPHSAVLMVQDLTERKRLEATMVRIAKLESLAVLAGGVAHDFNNMLTGILANVSLARSGRLKPEDVDRVLASAEQAAVRASDLTRQLLTFSRGGTPVTKPMRLRPLLDEAVNLTVSGSNVRVRLEIAREHAMAVCDPSQLGQVFANLLLNAQQAMPLGGEIVVRVDDVLVDAASLLPLAQGRYVRVSVVDSGLGIPEEHLGRVFDPYFTTKETGSGIGLASAHSIIRKHGGHIEAESQLGHGATFRVYIPEPEGVGLSPEPRSGESPTLPAGARVLVMDDEFDVRAVLADILRAAGISVDTTEDGREAIAAYRDAMKSGARYDAVILDLTVPGGMGGKEAMRAILEADPDAVGIVSSGYSAGTTLAEYRQHGFSGVLPKPYTVDELSECLANALTGTNRENR
jgi:PAS domain S-box-containing protein